MPTNNDPNETIDLSVAKIAPKFSHINKTGQSTRNRIKNNVYVAIIGVSLVLIVFLYYFYMKNESQKMLPQIISLPAEVNQ